MAQFESNWRLSKSDFPEIISWMEHCQKQQIYQEEFVENRTLWTKTANGYTSKDIMPGAIRVTAHEDDVEDYGEPFQGCLHKPVATFSITLTSNTLTFEYLDKIQVASSFVQSTGQPKAPHDGATATLGCKSGTRTLTHFSEVYGKRINVTYTSTCQHSNTKHTITRRGIDQPFSPYIQTHTQKVTYNLDAIAKANNMPKKELMARMAMTSYLALPVGMGHALESTDGYECFDEIDLYGGGGLDHAVLIFMIWKQFGLTEEYIDEIMKKTPKPGAAPNEEQLGKKVLEQIQVLDACQAALREGRPFDPATLVNAAARVESVRQIAQENGLSDLQEFTTIARAKHASLYVLLGATSLTPNDEAIARDIATMHTYEYRDALECCDAISNICGYVMQRKNFATLLPISAAYEVIIDELPADAREKHRDNCRSKYIYGLAGAGNTDNALSEAQAFCRDADSNLAYSTLCMVYALSGNKEKALETYAEILRRNPQYPSRNTVLNEHLRTLGWIAAQ